MLIILNSDFEEKYFQIDLVNACIEYEYDYDDELYFYYIDDCYDEIMHELFFDQIAKTIDYKCSCNHLIDSTIIHSFLYILS